MSPFKPLQEQVLVITGASSGIGLATARLAASRGARVLLAARNEADLERATADIRAAGGRAASQAADVADPDQVEKIADAAIREFGVIDTWVNNAGVAMYGPIMELNLEDMRRLFDVDFWGAVHGSRTAVRRMARGGGLINVASALADRAIPLQGPYCAAKHALRAFSDSLRMELEEAGTPVTVSLVKPSSMDTPLFQKARTVYDTEPQPIPPVYDPEVTAKIILTVAERPVREITVGGMGRVIALAQKVSPRLTDRYMERNTFEAQRTDQPLPAGRPDNLYSPVPHDGGENGRNWKGRTKRSSLVTQAELHPMRTLAAATMTGLGFAALLAWRATRRRSGRNGTN